MQESPSPSPSSVAILDAGSQYGKLIDRRIRELGVQSELLAFDTPASNLTRFPAIVISGGPESVYSPTAHRFDPGLFEIGVPILGICYGMQLINHHFGGKVEPKGAREDGQCVVDIETNSPLFKDFEAEQRVLLTHGDSLDEKGVAKGFRVTARSGELVAALESAEKKIFGLQFHPEVDLTERGKDIFSNFLFGIAGVKAGFTIADREQRAIEEIRAAAGAHKKVLALVSGGVDSSVCVTLLNKALGSDRVVAIHIDHGLMRKNESDEVAKALGDAGVDLKVIDATETFANSRCSTEAGKGSVQGTGKCLKEVVNPEEKRQIIGDTFMVVAEQAIREAGLDRDHVVLAQGTLRPDLIESASKMASSKASVIKTHHNDTFLVRQLREEGRVVEPLKDYHKDEVRELGKMLGLPDHLVWRQPFPGPGLAVRILCAETPYVDPCFNQINHDLGRLLAYSSKVTAGDDEFYSKLRSCFARKKDEEMLDAISSEGKIAATVLPIQSVGVQGDGRTYNHVVALTDDGNKNWDQLFWLAVLLPKIFHKVNRVVYIYGPRISGPIRSITPTHLTHDVIQQLQEADAIVNKSLYNNDLVRTISQVPVVSVPLHFEKEVGHRSIAIRTIITNDFMTGHVAVPNKHFDCKILDQMVADILRVPGIARVGYDLTSKPPATTEWE